MDGFDQLTQVKSLREESARRTLIAQRRKLEAAVAEREQTHRRLDDFRRTSAEEENRMYRDLCDRVVRMRDIQYVNDQMQSLRAQQKQHEQNAKTADTQCESERRQLEVDRTTHGQARRIHEKFVDLADILAQQKLATQAHRDELEIEDLPGSRQSRLLGQEQPK